MSTEDLGGPAVYIDQMDPNNRWYDPKRAKDISVVDLERWPVDLTQWREWHRNSAFEPGQYGYQRKVEPPTFYNPYPIIAKDEKLEPGVDWKHLPPDAFDWDRWDWKRKAAGERSETRRRRVEETLFNKVCFYAAMATYVVAITAVLMLVFRA
ncbi:hypothetical protein CcrBL47_gp429 [Caulobacter phage BL47]|nr:hypothetical protein CcrBL47_gp429 [Caulobacter phage BL47]